VCSKKCGDKTVPLSFNKKSKYDNHVKSEKHLYYSGKLYIDDCLACGKSFDTHKKRQTHLKSKTHKIWQTKFDSILASKNVSLIENDALLGAYKIIDTVEIVKTKIITQFKQKLELANSEIARLSEIKKTVILTNHIECIYCNNHYKNAAGYTAHI